MINQLQYSPYQNIDSESYCDMNRLAKRYNAETKLLTAGTGKKVIIRRRKATGSYRPIIT